MGGGMVAALRQTGWPAGRRPADVIPRVDGQDLAEMARLAATCPAAAGQDFFAVDPNVSLSVPLPQLRTVGWPEMTSAAGTAIRGRNLS